MFLQSKVFAASLLLCNLLSSVIGAPNEGDSCTKGILYISDLNSTKIYGYDLDTKSLDNLSINQTIDTGISFQNLQDTHNGDIIASVYRGDVSKKYTDGLVTFVYTGTFKEDHVDHFHVVKSTPKELTGDKFGCARPIHFTLHDNKIAIFCDGFYPSPFDVANQVNTTLWFFDETKFGKSPALIGSRTIGGTHHGVTVVVDDNHYMYSVPLPQRVIGNSTNSLPSGFVVTDLNGNPINDLTDVSNKDKHCSGYHGSAARGNTFVMGCDSTHGGILVIKYDPVNKVYNSKALMYPNLNGTQRTGTFAEHKKTSMVVGNFQATNQTAHLFLFDMDKATVLATENILTLDVERQCAFDFEKSEGKHVFVFLINGKLRTYATEPMWKLINEVEVIPNMKSCAQASFVSGYRGAFIMEVATNTVIAMDTFNYTLHKTPLPFIPFSAVVSGVPDGAACLESDKLRVPTSAPTPAPLPAPKCGVFGMGMLCLRSGCGVLRRMLGRCKK